MSDLAVGQPTPTVINLKKVLGPAHVWALGVGIVLVGEFMGWNFRREAAQRRFERLAPAHRRPRTRPSRTRVSSAAVLLTFAAIASRMRCAASG